MTRAVVIALAHDDEVMHIFREPDRTYEEAEKHFQNRFSANGNAWTWTDYGSFGVLHSHSDMNSWWLYVKVKNAKTT